MICANAKSIIQNCYELHENTKDDGTTVLRIITKFEYPGTSDKVVIRVRPYGELFEIDDNGEATFYAGLQGGDENSSDSKSWAAHQWATKRIQLTDDGTLRCQVALIQILHYIHQMTMAALELFDVAMLDTDEPLSSSRLAKYRLKKVLVSNKGV
jgi:hypothetical protein